MKFDTKRMLHYPSYVRHADTLLREIKKIKLSPDIYQMWKKMQTNFDMFGV